MAAGPHSQDHQLAARHRSLRRPAGRTSPQPVRRRRCPRGLNVTPDRHSALTGHSRARLRPRPTNPTDAYLLRPRPATAVLLRPSAQASTIRARSASPCAVLRRLAHPCSVHRSASDNTSGSSLVSPMPPADRGPMAPSPPSRALKRNATHGVMSELKTGSLAEHEQ